MDEAAVDALYRGDPSEFVAERDALARRLRQEGDREGAAAVKALRRPTRVAWALNQLRDDRPDELAELLAVAAELREAQAAGDAARLREAGRRRRELVRALARAARQRLGGPAEVEATIEAAVLDPAVGERLAAGRLDREQEVAGFGDLEGFFSHSPVPTRAERAKAEQQAPVRRRPSADDEVQRRLRIATVEADDARAGVEEATGEVDRARAAAGEAEAEVERLEGELAAARSAARQARSALTAAERRLRTAEEARRRAEAALAKLSGAGGAAGKR